MKFIGITKDVQVRYALEKAFLASSCEYEEWDTPEKLCHLLFTSTPLIGEARLSSEQYQDFSQKGTMLFSKFMNAGEQSLSQLEKQILAAAVVFHVQEMDDKRVIADETDDHLWDRVLERLGFDQTIYGCKQQNAYLKLRNFIWNNLRVSTDHGKKYYNTLKMQALAPASSILELYNVIYQFYKKNLECQYEEAENAFLILAQNIQQKTKKERSDVDIDLGSGVWALKSSLKVLFQYQPEYMAAVCDAVTQKMDLLLRGDDPNFCDCNRWDILLKQWFQTKTFAEQEKMRQVRAKRIRQRIITKKESIHPEYLLSNAEIILRLPNIRLPEITRPPVAYLYQKNRLVAECKMSVYGDSMCYTTQEFSFDLEHIDGIHFDEGFDFRVEIRCGGNIVYDSLTELCRDYMVFNEKGFETSIAKCLEGRAWIIAAGDAKVEVDDPDDDYYDESVNYQCFYVSLLSTKALLVNGTDILQQKESQQTFFRCYCIPDAVQNALALSEGKAIQIYEKTPFLHIVLGEDESAKNYQIFFDSNQHALYEYLGENKIFNIPLPSSVRFCHSIKIKDFHTGHTVFETAYIILPQFSYTFSEPYYLNETCQGSVAVRFSGGLHTHSFGLLENQDSVQIPISGNSLNISIDVPKVHMTVNGENLLHWLKHKWYEDIPQTAFLKINVPQNVKVDLFLDGQPIPKTRRGASYELGNYIYSSHRNSAVRTLGAIIRTGNEMRELKITDIYFEPTFLSSPLFRDGTSIMWKPESYFIGPEAPDFVVELDNDTQEPWTYCALKAGKLFEKNFVCKPGIYGCRVFLDLPCDDPFITGNRHKLVWEDHFEIKDNPESRFENKCIRLTKVWFWSYETKKTEVANIHYNDALIVDIHYAGLSDLDGELECAIPIYEGILGFRSPSGQWNYMNNDPDSELYENINPITFGITGEHYVKVYNADGEPLQLDAKVFVEKKRVRIKNRKENCSVEDARKCFPISDEFAFREENDL